MTIEDLEKLECHKESWDEFELDVCFDKNGARLVFKVKIPNNSWFSIGFGASMTNTDMIAWFANDKVGLTKDYWSTSHDDPEEDLTSNLITGRAPVYDSVTDKMTFVTIRALDTGDS